MGKPKSCEVSLFDELGGSLVELLVVTGIMMIVMMAVSSMFLSQQTETRALSEKLASLDLERVLIAALADGKVCAYVLNNPTVLTFNSAAALPQTITLPSSSINPAKLYSGIIPGPPVLPGPIVVEVNKPASAISNSLVVQSIQLQIISGVGSNFTGTWAITFDSTKTVRAIKPVYVTTMLTVDNTIPAFSKITGCAAEGISFVSVAANSGLCASGCPATATANCPVGKKLLTGSCSIIGGGPANTFIAQDQQSGNGWFCFLWNNSAAANGVQATAVCY
jgi:hypothetical protein